MRIARHLKSMKTYMAAFQRPIAAMALIVLMAAAASFGVVKTWTGATDNKWTTAGNWSPSGAPRTTAPFDDVFFNQAAPSCSLAGTVTVQSITFTTDFASAFEFKNRSMSVLGNADFSTGGTITTGASGILMFIGTSAQQFTPAFGQTFPAIRQNGDGGTTIMGVGDLTAGAVTIYKGELNLGFGHIISVPSITNAAPSTGTLNFNTSTLRITTGNATFTSINVTAGSGKLVFARTGAQSFIPKAGATFPDIEKSGGGTLTITTRGFKGNALRVLDGTVILGTALFDTVTKVTGADTLNFSSATLVVTGDTADFGSLAALTQGTGKLYFTGAGDQALVPRPNDTLPSLYHTGSGKLIFSTNAVKTPLFSQSAGRLDFGNRNLTVTGTGSLTIANGTGTTVSNLDNVAIVVLGGTASLSGQTGNRLNLNPINPWTINVKGALNADQVVLGRSSATRSPGMATNSTDDGDNSGWSFSSAKIWDGEAGDGKWSSALNWSDDLPVASSDTVKFNATSLSACSVDVSDTVAGIIFVTSYTGAFGFSGHALSVAGNADFRSGGTVSGPGQLRFIGASAQTFCPRAGAAFPRIVQIGSGGTTVSSAAFTADTLDVASGTFNLGAALKHTVETVMGSGTLAFGSCTLQVSQDADFSSCAGITAGTGMLSFTGTVAQQCIPLSGATFPNIMQNGTVGTTLLGNLTAGNLYIAKGELNLGGVLTHAVASVTNLAPSTGSLNFGSSTLGITTGNATFTSINVTAGTGKLLFSRTGAQSFVPKAGATFPDIEKTGGGIMTVTTRGFKGNALRILNGTVNLGAGLSDTVTKVTGADSISFSTATLVVTGDTVDFGSMLQIIPGTGSMRFPGGGLVTLTPRNNDTLPAIYHTGTCTLAVAQRALSCMGYTHSAGAIDFGGFDFRTTGGGSFSIANGTANTVLSLAGAALTVTGNASFAGTTGNRLGLNPGGAWSISATGALNADYAIIGGSNASGGTEGIATNSIDGTGNTHWAFSSAKIWDGGAGDNQWSSANNWSDDLPVEPDDTVKFNGTDVGMCVLDVSDTVAGIIFTSSYTGVFAFSGNALSITADADFRTGGSVSGGGSLRLIGASAHTLYPKAGTTFPRIIQNGAGGTTVSAASFTADTLDIASGAFSLGTALKHTVGTLMGSGSLEFGSCTLQVSGNADFSGFSAVTAGTGLLTLNGTLAQDLTPHPTDTLPNILHTSTVGVTLLADLLARNLTIAKGVLSLETGLTHTVSVITNAAPSTGSIDFQSSTLQIIGASATFTSIGIIAGTGTLAFARPTSTQSFVPKAGATFPRILQSGGGTTTIATRGLKAGRLSLGAGTFTLGTNLWDTIGVVEGTAGTLNFSSGTLVLSGDTANFGSLSQVTAGTGTIRLESAGTQVIIARAVLDTLPAIVKTGSGALVLSTNHLTCAGYTQSDGVLDFNGRNIITTSAGAFSVTNGAPGTFVNLTGRTIQAWGNASFAGSSTSRLGMSPGGAWIVEAHGALNADWALIGSSLASSSAGTATNSIDGTGNANWNFSAAKTWDGGAGDNKWSSADNWSDDLPLEADDTAKFNSTFSGNCILDISDTVAGVIMEPSYAGAFDFNGKTLSVTGALDFRSGGAVTGAGALRFAGTSAQTFYPSASTTYPSVVQDGSGGTTISGASIATGSLDVESGTFNLGSALKHTVGTVSGAGTIAFGTCTLQVTGDADFSSYAGIAGTTGLLVFTGASAQNFTPLSTDTFPAVTQNGAGGTTLLANLTTTGALTIANGTLNLDAGHSHAAGSIGYATPNTGGINFGSSTLSVTSGAANFTSIAVTPGTGKLVFARASSTQAFSPKAGATFPDIQQSGGGTTTVTTRGFKSSRLILSAGTFSLGTVWDTAAVFTGAGGTLNFSSGKLVVTGDTADFHGIGQITPGTGILRFAAAAGTQVLVPRANDTLPAVEHTGAGALLLATNPLKAASLSQSAGVLDLGAQDILTTGNLTVTNGTATTFANLDGRTITVVGNAGFTGTAGNHLNLDPAPSGFTINATGTLDATLARIANSSATGSMGNAVNCEDGLGNSRWNFSYVMTWDGGAHDGKWSSADNWTTDEVPTVLDSVLFNGTSTENCQLDIADTVAAIVMTSAYTGTFDFSSSGLHVTGTADLRSGGAITSSSGSIWLAGASAQTFYTSGPMTFVAVNKEGAGTTTINGGGLTANAMNIDAGTLKLGYGYLHQIITITGNGGIDFDSSTLRITGPTVDLSNFVTMTANKGYLELAGASAQQLTLPAGATMPHIRQTGAGGATLMSNLTAGTLTMGNGTLNLGAGLTHSVTSIGTLSPNTGIIDFGSSTLKVTSGNADFTTVGATPNAGTLEFSGTTQNFIPRAGATFPNIKKSGSGTVTVTTRGFKAVRLTAAGGTFSLGSTADTASVVTGASGTLDFGTGSCAVSGDTADFSGLAQVTAGTGALRFTAAAGTQTLIPRANDTLPAITHSAAARLLFATNPVKTAAFTQSAGGLDFGGQDLSVYGAFSLTGGTSTTISNLAGRTIMVTGAANFAGQTGNLLNLDAAGAWTAHVDGALTASYATIGWSGATHPSGIATNSSNAGNNTNWIFRGVKVWDGEGGDGNWSTAANWTYNSVPQTGDTVRFDGTNTGNCLMDASPSLKKITFTSAYIGAFNFGSGAMSVTADTADFRTGGAISASTGSLHFAGTTAQYFCPDTGATFPALYQEASGGTTIAGIGLTAGVLTISSGTFNLGATARNHTIAKLRTSGGGLTMQSCTLSVSGDTANFSGLASLSAASGLLLFSGGSGQIFLPKAALSLGAVRVDGAGGVTIAGANLTAAALTVAQGTLALGSGLSHSVTTVAGAGGMDFGSSTLTAFGATVNFGSFTGITAGTGRLVLSGASQTFTPMPGGNFPDIKVNASTGVTLAGGLSADSLQIAQGTLDLGAGYSHSVTTIASVAPSTGTINFNTATLSVSGAADFSSINVSGTGTLAFSGTGGQAFSPKAGATFPLLSQTGSGTTAVTARGFKATGLSISAGVFDLAGFSDTAGTMASSGGALNFGASAFVLTGATADFGSLVAMDQGTGALRFTGSGTQTFTARASDTMPAVTHAGTGTLDIAGALTTRAFTSSDGGLDFNGNAITTVAGGALTITNGGPSTISGLDGTAITTAGNASFTGTSTSSRINLDGTSAWTIDAGGILSAEYATITWSDASAGNRGTALNSVNNGHNFNWDFGVPDSLLVKSSSLMPTDTIGELEKNVPALRLIIRHPDAGGATRAVTRIEFTMTPLNPSNVVAKKILRRKDASENLYESSTIETSNPMAMDLSSAPAYVRAGESDTFDVLFDVVAAPTGSVRFQITDTLKFDAQDSAAATLVRVRADAGASFPLSSATGVLKGGTNTPSGKTDDGSLADWNATDERLDRSHGTDDFYCTWDNNNWHFAWNGRDLSTSGDLFIYIHTTGGGDSVTWNYGSNGTHKMSTGFGTANYCLYYDIDTHYGLRDGAASYDSLPFTGTVAQNGNVTELTLPFSDIAGADSIRIIPFVQKESSGEILASMPHDGVGEFVRNPDGLPTQTFLSWFKVNRTVYSKTPKSVMKFDSASGLTKPTWTYNLGSGNYAVGMTVGYKRLYVSVGGNTKKIVCLYYANGAELWSYSTTSEPTTVSSYFDRPTMRDMVLFCEGNNFRMLRDDSTSCTQVSGYPVVLGGTGGKPARSQPPDGGNADTVYAYVTANDGKLYKIELSTHSIMGGWPTADISANRRVAPVALSGAIYIGCTDGLVLSRSPTDGSSINGIDLGDSINEKITYVSSVSPARMYAAAKGTQLHCLGTDLADRWSSPLSFPDSIFGGVAYMSGTSPPLLYCPAGFCLRNIRDDGSSATTLWADTTTGNISTDPVTGLNTVYFASDDKRLFAVSKSTGALSPGWPTAVLDVKSRSRVISDATSPASIYFGAGDGKIYRYPRQ